MADTGLSEAVVRYHLRFLESHGLVHTVRDGRARRSYPIEARGRLAEYAAQHALAGRMRRQVARALVGGATTQREIAAAAGLAQRLVSYHLARLVRDGLAVREGARPARYAPDARLARMLGP
jgi:predicted transcriptional regulator